MPASNTPRRIQDFARVVLTHLPTPLERMPRLSDALGARLHIKRDDCTGFAMGGNKSRKLEYVLAHMLASGRDTVITSGAVQSNHVRQTAAAAAKLGLRCRAVLSNPIDCQDAEWLHSGNFHLNELYGAQIEQVAEDAVEATVAAAFAQERDAGRMPYIVPVGASDGLGSLGYVQCAQELLAQFAEQGLDVSHVVLATGSAGTHAGMLHGLRAAGSDIVVSGFSVSEPAQVKRDKVRRVSDEIAALLGVPSPINDADILVSDEYVGEGYAIATPAVHAATLELARSEGILVDPVYTAKALAGFLDMARRKAFPAGRDAVFLHTGGTPALFACVERHRPALAGPTA